MASILRQPEGGARPQTSSDRDTGWLRRKANYEKEIRLISGKSFMVANSSGDGMANSVRNESRKGSQIFQALRGSCGYPFFRPGAQLVVDGLGAYRQVIREFPDAQHSLLQSHGWSQGQFSEPGKPCWFPGFCPRLIPRSRTTVVEPGFAFLSASASATRRTIQLRSCHVFIQGGSLEKAPYVIIILYIHLTTHIIYIS